MVYNEMGRSLCYYPRAMETNVLYGIVIVSNGWNLTYLAAECAP